MSDNNSFTVCGSSSDIDNEIMEKPSATSSTLTNDLQVDSDQWSFDLAPLLYPDDEQSEVGILQACDSAGHCPSTDVVFNMEDPDANTTDSTEDGAYTVDDLSQRPRIVCAISELRNQQETTTLLTKTDFKVLDEITEELLVTAVKKSLNVPPVSLCPNEQSSSDDESITSPVPWIMVPRVLDRLLEFDEVSSEIKNANTKYGMHLQPLPSCLVSAPELESRLQPCESLKFDISTPTIVSVPSNPELPDLDVETLGPAEISSTANQMSKQVAGDNFIPEDLNSEDCMTDIAVISAGDGPDLSPSTSGETELPGWNTAKKADITAVERVRPVPHRSFWRRTKKFVRRVFCCGSTEIIDQ
ncbi:unnamed protein product [Macrosiphum euphorbiae]|uniref:Uncharacterized protein n=1 Tax=Macrosiphum euphorbiae TaxID=13131 RepID=A0AAV0XKW3_9HEMI|nr:unnamed protein product [Macrosiphum euphorbiae]